MKGRGPFSQDGGMVRVLVSYLVWLLVVIFTGLLAL